MNIDVWFSHLTRKMLGGLFLYNPMVWNMNVKNMNAIFIT